MKFTVTFKTPDAVDDTISDIVLHDERLEAIEDGDERLDAEFALKAELKEFTEKWVRYGEYVDVEFDTDAGTVTVLENGR